MSGFSASPAQRRATAGKGCVICMRSPCDPAHVVSRAQGGCDDARCTIPLCRPHHRAFDAGELDILPALEPHHRAELAHALQHVGLVRLYQRVTGTRLEEAA